MKGKKEKSKLLRRILCAALALGIAAFMIFGTVMSAFADSGDVLPLAKDTKEDKPEELLFSKSGILYEATTDQVLFEQNADVEAPMASMTKVMTAVVVLDQNPELEGEFTVSGTEGLAKYYSVTDEGALKPGEVISFYECMKDLLIPSANEAADALAVEVGGSISGFVDMMNAKAKELGMEHTHYSDPSGLTGVDHYTTPRDMLTLCRYAMTFEKFREIVSQKGGALPTNELRKTPAKYETTDLIMNPPDDRYASPYSPYIKGIKTGSTNAAGYCFSGYMEKDGYVYYSVVMGGKEVQYDESRKVLGDFIDTIRLYNLTEGFDGKAPASSGSGLNFTPDNTRIGLVIALIVLYGVWTAERRKKS
ncbi:MAG: D-alanyl-D-alanine carboxypeptidase [Eubacterium sp.]|nr:D-alanyl-D-alanine carboxypeptidase [Eubacterium sp.]